MASATALPELSQPTTLLAHPTLAPAELARHAALPATGFSTTKHSTLCVGASYKLSSDSRALRRLKGTLPILVAGNALNLVNPQTQTPIQSFTLSSAETASCAPLTLLRSIGGGRSLRTTYIGIQSHTPAKSGRAAITATHELHAYVEQLSAKRKESAQVQVKKESLSLSQPVRLIHALGDGRLILTHPDDSLSIVASSSITYDDEASIDAAATALSVVDTVDATQSHGQQRSHFYVNVLDAVSAKSLIAGSSKIEEAALVGLRLAVTSQNSLGGSSTQADDDTSSSKKKKRSKRSKKDSSSKSGAADDAQEDEAALAGSATATVGLPSGSLTLELTAFVKSFDGASESESAISTVKLGNVKVPGVSTAKHVLDVQLDPDGRLVVLGIDGHLTSLKLGTSSSSEPILSNTNIVSLPALAPASNARPCSSSSASPFCCLLISRDHALIVGVTQATAATGDKERVVALIVDLELNAVLRQIDWAVPFVPVASANAASSGWLQRMTTISASRIAGSTSVITMGPPTISPRTSSSSSEKAEALAQLQQRRTCVLLVPFVVPEMSVLRDALGKGDLTAKWIHDAEAAAAAENSDSDASRSELLEQIKTINAHNKVRALSKDKDINSAITNYIEAATADGRMLETLTSPEADTKFYSELLDLVLPAPTQRGSKAASASASASTGFFSRSALLTLIKHPKVHPSIFATLKSLAAAAAGNASTTRAVSVQVNGAGLSEFWSRLGAHNDAQVVRAALKQMPDIGEETLVSLLTSALRGVVQSRQRTHVESSKAAKPYMALLAQLVQLRVSRPALRSALKVQLRDNVDQVMALLQICNAWISQTIQLALQADEDKSKAKEAANGQVNDESFVAAIGQAKAPNADSVIAFVNDVLDAFFPLLLTTPRSHSTVQSLSSTISRYLQLMSTLRLLNAPLSAFAKLQQENDLLAAKAGKEDQNKVKGTHLSASGAVASAGNAKVSASNKTDASARAEMGGGLGLKLGTQGEQKTRRLQFLEQSMLVGAYSFERLEI